MEIKKITTGNYAKGNFGNWYLNEVDREEIRCTKEELEGMLGEYRIVAVKKDINSQFLFENHWNEDDQYAIFNLINGLDSIRYEEKLLDNDKNHDTLIII